jgi:type III restriction enzyme
MNRAYAFATTTAFQKTATNLQEGLVANGFERIEAKALVRTDEATLTGLEEGGSAYLYEESLPEGVDAAAFKLNVETATGHRVKVDVANGKLLARGALTDYDRTAVMLAVPATAASAVEALVHKSRGARLKPPADPRDASRFAVPLLCVRKGNGLELFDRAHFLDVPWPLETCDPAAIIKHFAPPTTAANEAHLNVSNAGTTTVTFVQDLHEQLALTLEHRGWSRPHLINWLDRRLPLQSRQDITRTSSTLFIKKALDTLESSRGMTLEALAYGKAKVLDALTRTIADYREEREKQAFQRVLVPSVLSYETSHEAELEFDESKYAYRQPYRGGTIFNKHFCRVVGDLEPSGEEYACAVYLERLPQVKTWVRNTASQPHSFWLQTSTDKFYPDFVALLEDGRVLVVEYKG